jgi:hypothetical protein
LQQALKKWFNIDSDKYKEWVLSLAMLESAASLPESDDNLQDDSAGGSVEVIAEDDLPASDVDSLISENKKLRAPDDF